MFYTILLQNERKKKELFNTNLHVRFNFCCFNSLLWFLFRLLLQIYICFYTQKSHNSRKNNIPIYMCTYLCIVRSKIMLKLKLNRNDVAFKIKFYCCYIFTLSYFNQNSLIPFYASKFARILKKIRSRSLSQNILINHNISKCL